MKNMPNLLSFSRILATLLVFVLAIVNQPWSFLVATVIFFLASVTDLLDGYLARRYHLVSPLGIFLDLTADKVFVSAILVAFVQIGLVPAWIVVIVITREFLVTGLRSVASAKGTVIPAGKLGKQKTFITLLAIGGILLAKGIGANHLSLYPPLPVKPGRLLTARRGHVDAAGGDLDGSIGGRILTRRIAPVTRKARNGGFKNVSLARSGLHF
jgi:CDP-diacylglycerol--glycerol-3-phosphate 3-phosphatidyltransferase